MIATLAETAKFTFLFYIDKDHILADGPHCRQHLARLGLDLADLLISIEENQA